MNDKGEGCRRRPRDSQPSSPPTVLGTSADEGPSMVVAADAPDPAADFGADAGALRDD